MEDNFNQNDFEEFLQDQVRNHRMYPSDAVWREIDKKLHGEKRWPALTVAASMLLTATVLLCVYFTPQPNIFIDHPAGRSTVLQVPGIKNTLNNITAAAPFAIISPGKQQDLEATGETLSEQEKVQHHHRQPNLDVSARRLSPIVSINKKAISSVAPVNPGTVKNTVAASREPDEVVPDRIVASASTPLSSAGVTLPANDTKETVETKGSNTTSLPTVEAAPKNAIDHFLKEHPEDIALHSSPQKVTSKNKFSYQIYVAPSFSYRNLVEDNSMVKESNTGPVALNYVTDVNKVVRHKPATGIELGVSFMYNLSEAIRVKSGFQFNMRQYSIEAYRSTTELASIALMGNNRIDTVKTLSSYRNNNGYSSAELVNRYYQLSLPVGIEWEVFTKNKFSLNVAGTIQPTYLLNRDAYLISTNFKNYAESPGMIRQWNINTNIEAFVSFKVGDFKWQLGPQIRYQPYSTFIPQYPIKEHLMDYGIKLATSRIIN
jgi:hypothetical protein